MAVARLLSLCCHLTAIGASDSFEDQQSISWPGLSLHRLHQILVKRANRERSRLPGGLRVLSHVPLAQPITQGRACDPCCHRLPLRIPLCSLYTALKIAAWEIKHTAPLPGPHLPSLSPRFSMFCSCLNTGWPRRVKAGGEIHRDIHVDVREHGVPRVWPACRGF